MADAAEILGVAERTFRRGRDQYKADGAEGLQDRRIGQASARAVPVEEVLQMVTLYQPRYTGWTVKHFHERWHTEHGGTRSYTWTKKTVQGGGTGDTGPAAWGASQEATTQTVAGDDAPPRWLHA